MLLMKSSKCNDGDIIRSLKCMNSLDINFIGCDAKRIEMACLGAAQAEIRRQNIVNSSHLFHSGISESTVAHSSWYASNQTSPSRRIGTSQFMSLWGKQDKDIYENREGVRAEEDGSDFPALGIM